MKNKITHEDIARAMCFMRGKKLSTEQKIRFSLAYKGNLSKVINKINLEICQ